MNIFIIEDEKTIRVPLADELREAGYRVKEFRDSHQALKAVQRQPVDVVITDMKMPGLNGLEILTRLMDIKPDVPVVVITAYGSEDTAIAAMERGAYDYIEKPFDLDDMVALMARIKKKKFIDNGHR